MTATSPNDIHKALSLRQALALTMGIWQGAVLALPVPHLDEMTRMEVGSPYAIWKLQRSLPTVPRTCNGPMPTGKQDTALRT
jgi:hypothetical protein